jgi:hypothetical protein
MWTEPLSWAIVIGTAMWIVWRVLKTGHHELRHAAIAMALAVWVVAVLAVTVYPLDYLEAPASYRLEIENIVPLAGTIRAIADSDGWTMTPEALAAQKELVAAEAGVPAEEISLSPHVSGPGLDAVLRDPIGNVVLFVPLGLLLPLGWAATRELKNVVLAGAGVSTIIELSQLLGLGSVATIDDVIFNTLGAVIGFALWLSADGIVERTRLGASKTGR